MTAKVSSYDDEVDGSLFDGMEEFLIFEAEAEALLTESENWEPGTFTQSVSLSAGNDDAVVNFGEDVDVVAAFNMSNSRLDIHLKGGDDIFSSYFGDQFQVAEIHVTGGEGSDIFRFSPGQTGNVTIEDFQSGDALAQGFGLAGPDLGLSISGSTLVGQDGNVLLNFGEVSDMNAVQVAIDSMVQVDAITLIGTGSADQSIF